MSTAGPVRIAPSVLDADFGRLAEQIAAVEAAGADVLHLDVMDGHFVPNLSIGVPVVAGIARHTRLLLDTHLMISDPARQAPAFARAGSGSITFHIEAERRPEELIRQLRGLGVRVGVSLNPGTPADALYGILDQVDLVLVMTVWPGFGGQRLIVECLEKVAVLARRMKPEQWLQVDGGVNLETAPRVVAAGANTLVIGKAIFGEADPGQALVALRGAAEGGRAEAERRA